MPLLDSGYSSTASLVGHPTAFYSFSFPPFPPQIPFLFFPMNSFPSLFMFPFHYVAFHHLHSPSFPLPLQLREKTAIMKTHLVVLSPYLQKIRHVVQCTFQIQKINKIVSLPSDTKDTQHLSHTEIDANMARSLIPAGCVQRSSLQHLVSEELC